MGTIDRIRYYDGEFLRAFDFNDEQSYHVEMRRRMNRYLHLYGIVEGLNLSADTEAGVTQVSIMPGLAIDAFGREIYVFAPYTLGDSDITANRVTIAGPYDVWIRYQKTASTPPSSGYSACNQANQYTRWVESFSIELLPSPTSPFTPPGFSVDDTDNPSQDQVAVLLGRVNIAPTSPTATFSSPFFDPTRVKLLGVIAQRIHTPPGWHPASPQASGQYQQFSFVNSPSGALNTPLCQPVSLEIKPNVFADQNLIVGPDFPLTASGPTTITLTPSTSDTTPGNVKIAGDLFVQGNIYNLITSTTPPATAATLPPPAGTNLWLAINSYVKTLVQQGQPDIAFGSLPISVPSDSAPVNASGYATKTDNVPVQSSRLTSASSYIAFAYFSQIQLNPSVVGPPVPQLSIQTPPPAQLVFNFTGGQSGIVQVPWQAGPAVGSGPSNFANSCAIDNFTISCIVFLFP